MFLFLVFAVASTSYASPIVSKIGFGSCMHQDNPQEIWRAIGVKKPDLFVLLGDNIYAKDLTEKKEAYKIQSTKSTFVEFQKKVPLYGIWDDNDYGTSDSGGEYPFKKESKELFLDFFKVPKDHSRRSHEGIYDSVMFGPKGKRIQLLLLDTRTFRSLPKKVNPLLPSKRYVPDNDPAKTVLGEVQWYWLEEQLKQPAEVRLIASGIQVLHTQHEFESWNNFPHERKKLFDLINKTKANGVIFLSGDRHKASIMKNAKDGKYPLYEVTSSGLTQTRAKEGDDEPDIYRSGSIYYEPNFGLLKIDWDKATIELQINSDSGELKLREVIKIGDLTLSK